ncbi:MAG: XdhC family protein, partial [Terriglobus roseus]|nr:XdhC family protein [Terriglobus roseus]
MLSNASERRRIVELWRKGNAVAMATLVHVEGSSYRAAGARILIARDGTYVGSVSGGCLEAEIVRKAQWMVRAGAQVVRYSTLFDDTADIPYGLGCGGTVDVLLEPAGTPDFEALMHALEASLAGEVRRVTTWEPTAERPLQREVSGEHLQPVYSSAEAAGIEEEGFSERLDPPQRLLIFGAGDDAQPLVRMASQLGWTLLVVDGRAQWARASRFPEADRVVAAQELGDVRVNRNDAVVLMTHSYEQDRQWLEQVLPCQPCY